MQRSTVVLPDPEPPAIPITTGGGPIFDFGLLFNHRNDAGFGGFIEGRGRFVVAEAGGMLPAEERFEFFGCLANDEVDELPAQGFDVVRDRLALAGFINEKLDPDKLAIGMIVFPGITVDGGHTLRRFPDMEDLARQVVGDGVFDAMERGEDAK